MTRRRRLFRDLSQADVEQMGRNLYDRAEARWNREQEEADARRDEREAREIREIEDHEQ